MTRILIFGETGQLAQALRALDWPEASELTVLGRNRLGPPDLADAAAHAAIEELKPKLVLNAAAYTAVDRAEAEPLLARALNADLVRAVTGACAAHDIPLVHVSTDYVFDGTKNGAYVEIDAPNPLGIYAATKLAGDRNVEDSGARRWAILRTSWVFSAAVDSFPAKILRRALAGEALRVVDDQVGCPTPVGSLAGAMQAMGLRLLAGDVAAQGLFNFCGAQAMSWYGFADKLIDAAVEAGMKRPDLRPVASGEFPAAAKRPRNSVLDCSKILRDCGIARPEIEREIGRVVRAILAR